MSKQLLTREVMYREVNSVGQAFPRDPWEGELAEENALVLYS